MRATSTPNERESGPYANPGRQEPPRSVPLSGYRYALWVCVDRGEREAGWGLQLQKRSLNYALREINNRRERLSVVGEPHVVIGNGPYQQLDFELIASRDSVI